MNTVKNKFFIGQTIWCMVYNEPVTRTINAIRSVSSNYNASGNLEYLISVDERTASSIKGGWKNESEIAESKTELVRIVFKIAMPEGEPKI